jgi:purine catabolism regulator
VEIAQGILETLETEISGIEVEIGIGKVYEILSISKSFNEAQDSFNMASGLRKGKVVHYDNHMIVNLLRGDNSNEKLMDFYKNTIGKLVEYDKENGTNLVETMEAYFRQNGNITEAAKELFVHRNTLIYRIDKIKMILDSDLKDSEELLEIQLGFKIRNILKSSEK